MKDLTTVSFLISSALASRTSVVPRPCLSLMVPSTASRSIFWSNATNISASRRCGPYCGHIWVTVGAGVANLNDTFFLRIAPDALLVPAGISTAYSVAAGNLTSGSNSRVFDPIHRHLPFGVGDSFTGTPCATVSACEVIATIGWLKVIDRCGATGTSPSGAKRSTLSSVPSTFAAGGFFEVGGGGKVPLIRLPVCGGGSDFSRTAKSVLSPLSATSGESRLNSCSDRASSSFSAGGTFSRSPRPAPPGLPSDSRTARPGGASLSWTRT